MNINKEFHRISLIYETITRDLIYCKADDDNLEEFYIVHGDTCEYLGYMYSSDRDFQLTNIPLT